MMSVESCCDTCSTVHYCILTPPLLSIVFLSSDYSLYKIILDTSHELCMHIAYNYS